MRRWISEHRQLHASDVPLICVTRELNLKENNNMSQDQRTKEILKDYNKMVEGVARRAYLTAASLTREIDESRINPEDIATIKMHIINMLSAIKKP